MATPQSFWGKFIAVGGFFCLFMYAYIKTIRAGYIIGDGGKIIKREDDPITYKAALKSIFYMILLTGGGLLLMLLAHFTCFIACLQ